MALESTSAFWGVIYYIIHLGEAEEYSFLDSSTYQ